MDKITGHRADLIIIDDPLPDWSGFPVVEPSFEFGRLPPPDVENLGLFDLKSVLANHGVDPLLAGQLLSPGRLTSAELRAALDDGDQDTRL